MKDRILNQFQSEIEKDKQEVDKFKQELIKEIRTIKKEEIFENKPKKLTIWKRLKKALGF